MAIADIEQTAFDMHREVQDRAGRDIRQIHVAAVIIRLQRRNRLDLGGNSDGSDERLVGQRDLVTPAHAIPVDMHHPHPLGAVAPRDLSLKGEVIPLPITLILRDGLRPSSG